ncbi:DDE Tnp 1 7 domain containing protein, partial [Asbolus verrucosus]
VVLDLLDPFLDCGHSVFLDNYYNSFDLVEILSNCSTYCTGTLNAKRKGNPKEVLQEKLKKGEITTQYVKNIIIGKWKDKRDVLFISNEYNCTMIEYIDKRQYYRKTFCNLPLQSTYGWCEPAGSDELVLSM